ncbi:MAG TPA: hypothetical protein VG797_10175 [Phycisphaerales bacterium]|nr:hypothetical protein [Phycisphaerales bacterium]
MASNHAGGSPEFVELLRSAAEGARRSGLFARVEQNGSTVECVPEGVENAAYRVEVDGGRVFVGWASPDRWMSQSIEAELNWTGDDLQELLADECRSHGYEGAPIGQFEHFRSEAKEFVFRNEVPVGKGGPGGARDAERVVQCLLGYEATFRELGDMRRAASEEE